MSRTGWTDGRYVVSLYNSYMAIVADSLGVRTFAHKGLVGVLCGPVSGRIRMVVCVTLWENRSAIKSSKRCRL